MVHSIELALDADTETVIRRIWADLAAAGVPSQAPASRPHVTLAVAERIDPQVDAVLGALTAGLPLGCVLGAPILFGQVTPVLARLIVPTAELLALHAEVHRRCGPHLRPVPLPNCVPGHWTPHVTMARRVGPDQLRRALLIVGERGAITGRFVGLRRWDGDARTEYPIGR